MMKKLFHFMIILASLLFIVACGQDAIDSEAVSVSEAAAYSTSAKTKALFETEHDSERGTEDDEDEAESEESETETASTADESVAENNDEQSSDDLAAITEILKSESSTKQTSSSGTSNANESANQSSGQKSKNNEQKTTSSNKNISNKSNKGANSKSNSSGSGSNSNTKTMTVTVSVESPKDLNGPNVGPLTVELSPGATAYDATKKAMERAGIEVRKTGSGATLYVQAIGGLGEFDAGPLSGWNVFVDGAMIPRSADAWEVSDGSTVHWRYTKNYLED